MFTIITASFNSEKTLEATIKSVLSQTYNDFEYIIVDGSSTDKTVDIIKRYIPLFNGKLRYISERDKGIYDAWNKGVKLSNGEWICFLGSDDILLSNALETYSKIIDNNYLNFITSRIELVDSNLNHIKYIGKPWSEKMKKYCCIAHVGSMHKKELIVNNGYFSLDYKICSDYDFLLRNYNFIIAKHIDIVTAKMRIGGVSNRLAKKALKETYLIKNRYLDSNKKFQRYIFYIYSLTKVYISNTITNFRSCIIRFCKFHINIK